MARPRASAAKARVALPNGVFPLRIFVCEPGSLYKTARGQSIWTQKPAQTQVIHSYLPWLAFLSRTIES